MEKNFNEKEKITSKEILDIISDYKSSSNKQLETAMNFIMLDFNNTKDHLIKMTNHLDRLEITYNKLLKEYKSRNAG